MTARTTRDPSTDARVDDAPIGRLDRIAEIGFWSGLVALVASAGLARAIGLSPRTLWHDDLWVAALTRLSLADMLSATMPVPQGFLTLLWTARRLFTEPEVAMQVVPYVAGLAGIVAMGLAIRLVTGSRAVGVLGAALVVWNAQHTHYSVFVKQYTLEFVSVTLLIAAVTADSGRTVPRFPLRAVVCALVACLVGIGTMVVGTVAANVVLAEHAWRTRSTSRRAIRSLIAAVAFNLLLAVYYWFILRSRSGARVRDYWQDYFVPTDSFFVAAQHLQETGISIVTGALVPQLAMVGWLVPLGLVALLWHPQSRAIGAIVVLATSAMISVSALRLYPLGGERTDIFLYPFVIVCAALGARTLLARVPRIQAPLALAAGGAVVITLVGAPGVPYYDLDQSDLIRTLDRRLRPANGLVIHPGANALTGFYSTLPIRTIVPDSAQLILEYDRLRTLSLGTSVSASRHALRSFLAAESYSRIWLIVARSDERYPLDPLIGMIQADGYEVRRRWTGRIKSQLVLFERSAPSE